MPKKQDDPITRPSWYYNRGKATMGPLDYAVEQDLNIAQHAVVKYITRAGRKPGNSALKDYKQAKFYLDWLIAAQEAAPAAAEVFLPEQTPQENCVKKSSALEMIKKTTLSEEAKSLLSFNFERVRESHIKENMLRELKTMLSFTESAQENYPYYNSPGEHVFYVSSEEGFQQLTTLRVEIERLVQCVKLAETRISPAEWA
jgi:hypothetical protein